MLVGYELLRDRGLQCEEFCAPGVGREITAMIASPAADYLDPDPVLLLTVGGQQTHLCPPNDQPAKFFWQRGHRVVSFPIAFEIAAENALKFSTQTTGRVYNPAIEELRDQILQGTDPFSIFIEEAKSVLNICIDRKWAKADRIVVTGISRFAYLAFRLMAADDRLAVGGGFAPVTDWRDLSEFYQQREMKEVAALRLSCFVEKLAGKKIYMAIGSHDERVNTLSCCQFFLDLNRENQRRGFDGSLVDFHCTPDPHHTCSDEWYQRGMEILLTWMMTRK